MEQNDNNQPPTPSELMGWANTYGITHPIVTDPDFDEAVQYLWANPSFDGSIGLPNMQLLSSGMVVEISNGWPSESTIVSYLP